MTKTALYRHFDADGALLYVGISGSHLIRLAQHLDKAAWAEEIATITVERFASREQAQAAERNAIHDEHPRHNIVKKIVILREITGPAPPESTELIQEIEAYAAERDLSPATVVSRAVDNGRLYGRLKSGHSCTLRTAERIRAFIQAGHVTSQDSGGRG